MVRLLGNRAGNDGMAQFKKVRNALLRHECFGFALSLLIGCVLVVPMAAFWRFSGDPMAGVLALFSGSLFFLAVGTQWWQFSRHSFATKVRIMQRNKKAMSKRLGVRMQVSRICFPFLIPGKRL